MLGAAFFWGREPWRGLQFCGRHSYYNEKEVNLTARGLLKYDVVSMRDHGFLKHTLNKYFLLKLNYTLKDEFTCFLTNFTPSTSINNTLGVDEKYP